MASSGKNKRKVKGKTVDLCSFLGDNAPSGFAVVTPRRDWADCVEEENDDKYTSYRKEDKKIVLPTAPKAARGPDFDVNRIPSEPPFTAYIGNLPYDITEEEILQFFGTVTSVRLPRDGGERGRMRGFGYAEFADKQSLIEGLSLNGETLKNRPVKVSLAGDSDNERPDRKNDGIDRTAGDWRAGPKGGDDSFPPRNQWNDSRFDDSDREPYRGRSSFGEDKNRFDTTRTTYQGRRSTEREYGFGSDRDRGYNRRYGDGGFDSFDRNREFERSGDRRDDFDSRPDDKDTGFSRGGRSERSDFGGRSDVDQERDRPKERVRLQLKPRSVPVGATPTPIQATSASIFGGAKPVDTAAKEREIELRLAKERAKQDDVIKPKYSSQSSKQIDERNLRDDDSVHADDELVKENRFIRDESNDRSSEDSTHCTKNGAHTGSVEQENGEHEEFLTNKFAYLSNQEE